MRGQYRKATLIERYDPDANMVDLRSVRYDTTFTAHARGSWIRVRVSPKP
jgi:hypothetical protein